MGHPLLPSPIGRHPNPSNTRFHGFGTLASALGFPHIQFWAPAAATRVYVIDQIAIACTKAAGVGVVALQAINAYRHNAALATASASEPWEVGFVDVAGTHNGSVRVEDAAAPLAGLGTLMTSFAVPAELVQTAAAPASPGQVMIYPVAFRGLFDATNGITFVPQDANVVGFYVGIWWSEVRLNT
jgi:hypothetical protein